MMIKTTKQYINDGLIIEYSEPSIQPFHEGYFEPITTEDIMYFYYTVKIYRYKELDETGDGLILAEKELIFEERTHDFPKVADVPDYIDYIINEPCNLKITDYESDGFHKIENYNQIILNDFANCEYWYKIERYDTSVKQRNSEVYKDLKKYMLTIGKGFKNQGFSDNKDNGVAIYLDNLTEEELLKFKKVCEDFLKSAIDYTNEYILKAMLKCPYCNETFKLSGTNIKDEWDDYIYKCSKCSKIIKEDEWDEFWDNMSYE